MISLTVHITQPDVVRGDARTAIYNSVAQTLDALGPEWNHKLTLTENGSLKILYERNGGSLEIESIPTHPL